MNRRRPLPSISKADFDARCAGECQSLIDCMDRCLRRWDRARRALGGNLLDARVHWDNARPGLLKVVADAPAVRAKLTREKVT